MGSRRVNLIIVAVVLALLAGSLYVIFEKPTKLGLDLSGGTQLIYEANPTPENPVVDGEDIDRVIDIFRDRVDALGVSEPEFAQVGANSVQASLPDVTDAARAIEQIGTTAKLYFIDFEPNVIPLPGSDLQVGEVTPTNLEQQSTTSLYTAVELASRQEPDTAACETQCTRDGPAFYLFEKTSRQPVAGPEGSERDLFSTPEARAVPEAERKVFEVPEGTIVAKDQENTEDPTAPDRYFVLRDRPELSGEELENPEQSFDQSNQPDRHLRLHRRGARTRSARSPTGSRSAGLEQGTAPNFFSFGILLDGEIVSRPVIDYEENPDGHRRPLGRADLRHRRPPGRPGPGRVPEDRRAAGRPDAGQPEHRHRDARRAGARPGPQGGADRPRHRRPLLPPLLPLPGRDRGDRPCHLRDLLPRA